jgi:hypothetical protein
LLLLKRKPPLPTANDSSFGNDLNINRSVSRIGPGTSVPATPWLEHGWVEHSQQLLNSFARFLQRELIPRSGDPLDEAERLFESPFVVVSHGTQSDPLLNYGNRTALKLWEIDIPSLLQMPSRLTAEAMHRDERARLLERTTRDGFVDDYRGIRISSTGQRFLIRQAIVWNVVNSDGDRAGQAATFSEWQPL